MGANQTLNRWDMHDNRGFFENFKNAVRGVLPGERETRHLEALNSAELFSFNPLQPSL